jgi:predicted aldo/keto reductase-like oxidoreductase
MNQIPLTSSPGTLSGEMLYRTLGRTGERISAIGLGGFHIGKPSLTDDDSIRLIRTAIDRGITFMDNSWDYHEGQSEVRMGKALKDGYRQKVFLMTKIEWPDQRDGGAPNRSFTRTSPDGSHRSIAASRGDSLR